MNIYRKAIVRGISAVVIFSIFAPKTVFAAPTRSWSTNVITQEVNGVKWRFMIDTSKKTAILGSSDSTTGSDAAQYWGTVTTSVKENNIWVKKSLQGVVSIPSSFKVNDEDYVLEAIGNRALIRHGMSTLIFPENVGWFRNCAMYQCPYLTNLWFKGQVSPTDGKGRNYVNLEFTANNPLELSTAVKNVLVGPNLKRSGSNFKIPSATSALVLFPCRKDNTTWAGWDVGGTTPNVVYYHDLDETAGTITFSPTNATTLAEALSTLPTIKSQIKTAFGLDAKIVVSSPIETATAIPAAFLSSDIPLETTEWVAFSATTQEQIDEVLDACSADSKILIDPVGSTGRLVVPYGRNVSVLMPPNGEIKYDQDGIMIIVK